MLPATLNLFKIVSLFFFLFLCFVAQGQNNNNTNSRDLSYLTSGGKLHPLQAIIDIRHYTIALDINIRRQSIKGSVDVRLNLSKKTDTLLLNLVHLYTVTKINVNKKPAGFYQHDDKIFITSPTGFETGNHTVTIEYNGIPPVAVKPPWDGGSFEQGPPHAGNAPPRPAVSRRIFFPLNRVNLTGKS